MAEVYRPCLNGLHVCGANEDGTEPITVRNFPMSSAEMARRVFEKARAEYAAKGDEPADLYIDLCTDGDITTEFPMSRQQLDPLSRYLDGIEERRA